MEKEINKNQESFDVLAKNICLLRKNARLTQLEFAEKLNYSDKTVSKWETGEAVPGLDVLLKISELFGVSLDELCKSEIVVTPKDEKLDIIHNSRFIISLLAISAVWVIALMFYMFGSLFTLEDAWYIFVYAVPTSFAIAVIFNSIWGNQRFNYLFISLFVWTLLAALYLQFIDLNIWLIFTVGVPIQIMIILWSRLKPPQKNK